MELTTVIVLLVVGLLAQNVALIWMALRWNSRATTPMTAARSPMKPVEKAPAFYQGVNGVQLPK